MPDPSIEAQEFKTRDLKRVAVGIVEQSGKILVARRKAGRFLAHYWELPGGVMQNGESPEACVAREVGEETGLAVRAESCVGVFVHEYAEFTVEIHAYFCRALRGEAQPLDSDEIAWIGWDEISKYRFPPANEQIFAAALRLRGKGVKG